jgi:transcriptional regulator with XRE-family HTH domain
MIAKCLDDVNVTGNRLKAVLAERGLTQAVIADSSGVGRQRLSYIINEKQKLISSVTATLICVSLGIPREELFPNAQVRE